MADMMERSERDDGDRRSLAVRRPQA
ncbi:hypothetical protein BVI2075_80078 [Burkholderia vietnamiensis]|nr:hypothetical protein BVI2075_80078 [Burkholderia vietnamiensis]